MKDRRHSAFCTSRSLRPAIAEIQQQRELQEAVRARALHAEFQPIVQLATGDMMGARALARWNHPGRGRVPPDEFIPLAESSGLIAPIGEFVLERACEQLRAWNHAGLQSQFVSVNVSAMQLVHGDFVRVVRECVADYGVASDRLHLEIAASAPFDDHGVVIKRLTELARFGACIVLDGLGSGYMLLSHLTVFPVHGLKIGLSFIRSIPADTRTVAVVNSAIELAQRLELSVLVEGIETEEQVDWLRRFEDVSAQGLLYSGARTIMPTRYGAQRRVRPLVEA